MNDAGAFAATPPTAADPEAAERDAALDADAGWRYARRPRAGTILNRRRPPMRYVSKSS